MLSSLLAFAPFLALFSWLMVIIVKKWPPSPFFSTHWIRMFWKLPPLEATFKSRFLWGLEIAQRLAFLALVLLGVCYLTHPFFNFITSGYYILDLGASLSHFFGVW
jgi:hypothetical protein